MCVVYFLPILWFLPLTRPTL